MPELCSHTRPSLRVSLLCWFYCFLWLLPSEVPLSSRSIKLPSISQTCFQSCFSLSRRRTCAVPIATVFSRGRLASPRLTADKNTWVVHVGVTGVSVICQPLPQPSLHLLHSIHGNIKLDVWKCYYYIGWIMMRSSANENKTTQHITYYYLFLIFGGAMNSTMTEISHHITQ